MPDGDDVGFVIAEVNLRNNETREKHPPDAVGRGLAESDVHPGECL
jgi:hypothetical protein